MTAETKVGDNVFGRKVVAVGPKEEGVQMIFLEDGLSYGEVDLSELPPMMPPPVPKGKAVTIEVGNTGKIVSVFGQSEGDIRNEVRESAHLETGTQTRFDKDGRPVHVESVSGGQKITWPDGREEIVPFGGNRSQEPQSLLGRLLRKK